MGICDYGMVPLPHHTLCSGGKVEKYCYVFLVMHQYTVEYDADNVPIHETKEIGLYSKKELADAAVKRFSGLVGFSSYPNDFHVMKRRCYYHDQASCHPKSKAAVYRPYHEYYIPQEDCDFITHGAFFVDKEAVEAVLEDWKKDKELAEYPEGFAVIEYTVDEDIRLWSEGFNRD